MVVGAGWRTTPRVCDPARMVPAKPTLHLLALSALAPQERVRALADLFEQITGRKPAPEELEKALKATKAAAQDSATRRP